MMQSEEPEEPEEPKKPEEAEEPKKRKADHTADDGANKRPMIGLARQVSVAPQLLVQL